MKKLLLSLLFSLFAVAALSSDSALTVGVNLTDVPASCSFGFTEMNSVPINGVITEADNLSLDFDTTSSVATGNINMYYRIVNSDDMNFWIEGSSLQSNNNKTLEYTMSFSGSNGESVDVVSGSEVVVIYRYEPTAFIKAGIIPLYFITSDATDYIAGEYAGEIKLTVEGL